MTTNSTENTAVCEDATSGYDLLDSLIHNEKTAGNFHEKDENTNKKED